MQTINLINETATLQLGADLAKHLKPGDIVALTGGLGAGKTTLARGLIMAISDTVEVPSPTYTLVQTYDTDRGELWHCDMYRLERPEDAYELGLIDSFPDIISLIEWPDKLGTLLPENIKSVDIQFAEPGRSVTLTGWETHIDG